ncbi:IS30 family transposase [Leuconostoc gelidum]|uniref:IS30 family transposase n=1 Tax=Leuconostoc gelidum TaxID=1244 RepID=UPI001CC761F1|nr:IS30 family transposase [Leuconostoc gelidum]
MVDEEKRRSRTRITENERYMIEHLWNEEHWSQVEIGKKLGYSQGSIGRELERGNVLDYSNMDRRTLLNMNIYARIKYSAMRGQYVAIKNRSKIGTASLLTPDLKELIESWVNVEHWTPEQIAGNVQDVDVSASVIRLWAHKGLIDIRTHKYHRKTTSVEKKILDSQRAREREIQRLRNKLRENGDLVRHSIYERPAAVEKRQQFGHWEIDLVLPRKNNNGLQRDDTALMTLVERKTRFISIIKVRTKRTEDVVNGFKLFWSRYGTAVRTITADNGSEFISWGFLEHVQQDLGVKIYYCSPHAPHQRGTNENRNRKLRDFYPKGTSFENVNQRMLDETAERMNTMPMRMALGNKAPIQVFDPEYKAMQRYKRAYAKKKEKQLVQELLKKQADMQQAKKQSDSNIDDL